MLISTLALAMVSAPTSGTSAQHIPAIETPSAAQGPSANKAIDPELAIPLDKEARKGPVRFAGFLSRLNGYFPGWMDPAYAVWWHEQVGNARNQCVANSKCVNRNG